MSYVLIAYDKDAGVIIDRVEFDDRDLALAARFERERRERHRPGLEIVLLNAASEDDLRATHGRYFKTPAELAASIGRS